MKDFEIWGSNSHGVFRTYTVLAGTWKMVLQKMQMKEEFFVKC